MPYLEDEDVDKHRVGPLTVGHVAAGGVRGEGGVPQQRRHRSAPLLSVNVFTRHTQRRGDGVCDETTSDVTTHYGFKTSPFSVRQQ